jgi:hypothetical protein
MSEKWWDMSDDELDDLFREASDKVDVPFDSSAFNKLRQKIDSQPEAPKGFKKRWLLLLVGLFMLVGVGLVYRFTSSKESGLVNKNEEVSNKITEDLERKPNTLSTENQNVTTKSTTGNVAETSPLPLQKTQGTTEELTSKSSQDLEQKSNDLTEQKVNKSSVEVTGTHTQAKSSVKTTETHSQTTAGKSNKSYLETHTTSEETKLSIKGKANQSPLDVTGTNSQKKTEDKSIITEREKEIIAISGNNISEKESLNSSEKTKPFSKNTENQSIASLSFQKDNSVRGNWKSKNKKQAYSSNSKTNGLFQSIGGQNIYLPKDEESLIPKENTSEEAVAKTNFFGVDYLANKATKSLVTNVQPTEIQPYIDSLPRKTVSPKFSRFGVRLALAPDINSTESTYSTPLGSSFGILIEYKLSKKFILQTGVTFSNKKYNGSFDDYHNFANTWMKFFTSKPISVNGQCTVIDIPINLRMNVFQKPNQMWFVSTGVSTYIMPTEGYTYNFSWGPSKTVEWSDNGKYNWSILNFSLGFEKQFSKHLYFQVEPYLKTPLSGLGRGGLNLYSSGLLFSTKYAF